MSRGQTTKFRGGVLRIETGVETPGTAITAATATNPGTITASGTAVKGDVVTISGLGSGFDGDYVVSDVATGVLTLAGADWSSQVVPGSFTNAKLAAHTFSGNFCELTGFTDSGATVAQENVSTICSGMYDDFEPSSIDAGTLQLNFNAALDSTIQTALRDHEAALDTFWIKIELSNAKGTMLYQGSIQSGLGLTGSAGSSNMTSGVTLKLSGPKYFVAAA